MCHLQATPSTTAGTMNSAICVSRLYRNWSRVIYLWDLCAEIKFLLVSYNVAHVGRVFTERIASQNYITDQAV